jgi:hypothetical protein
MGRVGEIHATCGLSIRNVGSTNPAFSALTVIFIFVSMLVQFAFASAVEAEVSRYYYAGSRTFDLRVEVLIHRQERYFLLETIPWLDALLESDKVMRPTIFSIETGGTTFIDSVQYDLANNFIREVDQSSPYRVPGYVTFESKNENFPRYFFLSTEDTTGHRVICGDPNEQGTFINCSVMARYELDERVFLVANILRPIPEWSGIEIPEWDDTWPTFDQVADRMREIARCLDVTELVQVGEPPVKGPFENPASFTDCEVHVIN